MLLDKRFKQNLKLNLFIGTLDNYGEESSCVHCVIVNRTCVIFMTPKVLHWLNLVLILGAYDKIRFFVPGKSYQSVIYDIYIRDTVNIFSLVAPRSRLYQKFILTEFYAPRL